jgi:hypothetical protein
MGATHSTKRAQRPERGSFRQVLECGSPMPLLLLQSTIPSLFVSIIMQLFGVLVLASAPTTLNEP